MTTIIVPYIEYEWWLIRWEGNQILCRVLVDHEGMPSWDEVAAYCGSDLANEWWATPPCKVQQQNNKTVTVCTGLYFHLVSSQQKEREMIVELPLPIVWVNLEGCAPIPPENRCPELPTLVLTAEEPLAEESIVAIWGTFDGEPFYCPGDICKLPLRITPLQGVTVEFQADSSYGDSSEIFTAQVRVIDAGVSDVPGGGGWYVDVISAQWRGAPLASCARIWEAFPPIGSPPAWLSTPERFEVLSSAEPYYYLAGRLISQGLVDVSSCSSGGLLPNGYADVCGLEMARPLIEEWQNQFDNRIIQVSQETGVPAQLMKNLFAQESQFWPGVFRVPFEFGLGQITEQGTDAIFIWNPSFFQQFCPLVLSEPACAGGYLHLTDNDRSLLRGALALQARADCPDCPTGIDLTNTHFTIALFANTLQANCAQVSRSIYTATNMMAGSVSTYEDLWRLTIANYHAGSGCVSYAVHQAWQNDGVLTWEVAKNYFTDPCKGVIPYVEKIAK
ncbi:MAG: hypothetical protein JXA78_06975 [Anaerolineales bacterium]|nr:hypothetical protein [Anaerolineales bacterium]